MALKIGVVGAGYVGLSTAGCLAKTFVVEKNPSKLSELQKGGVPIQEKGLGALLKEGLRAKRIIYSSSTDALVGLDALFVAVGLGAGGPT